MSFADFFVIADILDNDKRLKAFAEYYNKLRINGLHYTNFFAETNVISICTPNHSTHHEATSFLLQCKNENYSINTIRNYGYQMKKLLDFLMLWDMDILDGDLMIILTGFVDYLRLVETKGTADYPLPDKAIEWAALEYVPLHREARTAGKVLTIQMDEYGGREKVPWGKLPSSYVSNIVSLAIKYFIFLKRRTHKYSYLNLGEIPVKKKYKETFLSGTLGNVQVSVFDIKYIMDRAGIGITGSTKRYTALKERIPTVTEMNVFFSSLPTNKRQNTFLFHILKCFGLRESEAANLMIDTSTLPKKLLRLNYFEAIEHLKDHLRGDVEFVPNIDKWVCNVVNRNDAIGHFQSRNKSSEDRTIPLFFSQDEFSSLLLDALKERELVMKRAGSEHPYLFVSRAPSRMGKRITGRTVYDKLKNTLSNYLDKESVLQEITPHTFRHYYATYCLRVLKHSVEDVQRRLGHSDKEVTLGIYSHYLHDNNNELEEKARDISDTFRVASKG
ncbi:tyrosine-type recombinase/integrase [Priestia aryabhattai]|uniref:tyrosine-type recombinase/integrase n=1 Tax=Priestia aryabhattai TaxID=412384 RepID=UPI00203E0242|nr:tyrosine-type recombinase/integrase [Priestia aryabhattai]MCM3769589.1 tyrosine-type recombinase/integrase [Priestia aryabhattai]